MLRQVDWPKHPLGEPSRWPSALQRTVETLLDNAQPMALLWGHDRFCFYNDAFRKLIAPASHPGVLAEPAGQSHAPVWESLREEVREVMNGGPAVWREAVATLRADGTPGFWTYAISPIRQDGTAMGTLLTCTSITASHPAELDAHDARETYRTVINAMDDAFAVIEVLRDDRGEPVDYRWLEVNAAHAVHTGLHNVVGQRASECLSHLNPEILQRYGETALTGRRQRFTLWYEAMDRWLEYCLVRVGRSGEGKVAVLARDVTTGTRLRTALEESERRATATAQRLADERQRLQAIFKAAPIPIFAADTAGRVVAQNAQAEAQLGPIAAQNIAEYARWRGWWPAGTERAGQRLEPGDWPIARALAGHDCHQELIEVEAPCIGGSRRHLLVSAMPIRNSDGAITGAVSASMDTTEQVRAQAELEAAHQRKDDFLALLAHELRNPLTPLSTAAALLTQGEPSPEVLRRCGEIIGRQVAHMAGLVDELNDISRVSRGLAELELTTVNLQDVIRDCVEQISLQMETRRHSLTVPSLPEPIHLHADRTRLVQGFTNLLANAARYTPPGGDISIAVETTAAAVRVAVRDNGIGMPAEFVAHAFEMFTQARRSADIREGGLGIGLALVKGVVQMHGGTVEASSAGEGHGSCFTVSLPRAA